MIRVLHYIPGFLYGGIESIFLDWYKNIDKKNFEFELLLRTQDDNASALQEYKILKGKYFRLAPITNFFEYKKNVKNFFINHHDYDILHVHESDPFILRHAKKYGIKKIVLHSHKSGTTKSLKEKLKVFDEKLMKNFYVDYAFACSKKAALWKFGGLRFQNNNVFLIHNAIDTSKFTYSVKERNIVRNLLGVDGNFVVGHVGRLTYQKNQFYMIDVFANIVNRVTNSILVIVGNGPYKSELKVYAEKLGLTDKIRFLGARSDVQDLLQAIDCFLLPSRSEGLPVTLVEAQASGLPCFISDKISREVDLVPNLIFRHDINESPKIWANDIINTAKNFHRKDTSQLIIKSGYDIKTEVNKLEKKYLEIVKS